MTHPSSQDRASFRASLRREGNAAIAAHFAPDSDETTARLVERVLHLLANGERAPGGDETWQQWQHDAEIYLRSRLDRDPPDTSGHLPQR